MIRKTLLAVLCIAAAFVSQVASAQFSIGRTNKSITAAVSGVDGARILIFDNRLAIDTSEASIRGPFGPVALADLQPGTRITAAVLYGQPDGTLVAESVQLLPNADAVLSGSIESVDRAAGTIRMSGQTIRLTPATSILRTIDGASVSSSHLHPMQFAAVELDPAESGLAAKTIGFTPAGPGYVTNGGRVTAINGEYWSISGGPFPFVVRVTEDTALLSNPQVGDRVTVVYRTDDETGDLVAEVIGRIVFIEEDDTAGVVKAIDDSFITIDTGDRNVRLRLDDDSVFVGATPQPGDLVVARTGTRSNTRVALEVELIGATDFTFGFGGTVTSINNGEWTVAGVPFVVTNQTRVIGAPVVGDTVEVVAVQVDETWYAILVAKP